MGGQACFAALWAALLLMLVSQVRAGCTKVENPNVDPNEALEQWACEGGSDADLDRVPDNVETLRITNMPIGRITESMFARFGRSLIILTCSHCSVSDIDDRAFARLRNLQQLSLDNNRLKTVRAQWFEGLSDLTYLDLNYNGIESIESGLFRNTPNLVDVRVSGNRLECLDLDALNRLKDLKRIFVNENPNFGCPNAVKRFLAERRLDSEADPEWNSIAYDRVQASAFGSAESAPPSSYPSSTPSAYTRQRFTEEPPTSGPTEPPSTVPPSPAPRRPFLPETVQPSVPDSTFSLPPYYPPQVTRQQIDNYQSNVARQNSTSPATTTTTTTTTPTTTTTTTTQRVLLAGLAEPVTTTTECPNAASSVPGNSALLLLLTMVMAAATAARGLPL